MKHGYYQPVQVPTPWRLPHTLPGRRILAAIWAWL